MSFDDDYTRFHFYIDDAIEQLRETENWSDKKIAQFLRDEASVLDPRKKRMRVTIPKEKLLELMEMKLKELEEAKS